MKNGSTVAEQESKSKKGAAKVSYTIKPPNLQTAVFYIQGTAPYAHHKFSDREKEKMQKSHEAGHTTRKGQKKEPKDFKRLYEEGTHKSIDGWYGIPCIAFRAGLISTCRLTGFVMTRAKLSLFIVADGYEIDGTPLVKITKGDPELCILPVKNSDGSIDLRPVAKWVVGWEAAVRVRFDADQFTHEDVANLLLRLGAQVGIGLGRPDSPKSVGLDWGLFEIIG